VIDLFAVQNSVMLVLALVLFGFKAVAFVDAVVRPDAVYVAAGKQTKSFWLLVLGLAVVANMLIWYPIGIINVIGVVAALVYLVDVRPALRALTRG